VVRVAGHEVVSLAALYAPVDGLVSTFRASGRFIWPLHQLVLAFGVWGCVRAGGGRRAATVLLTAVIAIQVLDTNVDTVSFAPTGFRQLPMRGWETARGHYAHLALVPMEAAGACEEGWPPDTVLRYTLQAYRIGVTINSGTFARPDVERLRAACAAQQRSIDAGELDPETIYVVAPAELPKVRRAGAICGEKRGDWICVDRLGAAAFRSFAGQP
jgi:hypothetical protein